VRDVYVLMTISGI